MKFQILNAAGKPVTLNDREERLVNHMQRIANDLGYNIEITTLTTIMKSIVEQKFFEVLPSSYLPVKVGEGAWSRELTTFRSFDAAGQFEDGIVNTGGQNARLASADAAVDAVTVMVQGWAKEITWSIMDLEYASRSGNWDVVTAKERARKKNWDLGIQRIAFLGARGMNGTTGSCTGLLNQANVNTNATVITKSIKTMDADELAALCANVYEAYRENCQRTAVPTHWVLPESDYNGLAAQSSPDFPIKSKLQILEEAMKAITQKPDFKILPLAYADAAYHSDVASIAGSQVYTLLNYDADTIRMNVPVPYTNTLANSLNNFQFQNVGFGQFSGVQTLRPLEVLYFKY